MANLLTGTTNSVKLSGIVGDNSLSKTITVLDDWATDASKAEALVTGLSALYANQNYSAKGFNLVQTKKYQIAA